MGKSNDNPVEQVEQQVDNDDAIKAQATQESDESNIDAPITDKQELSAQADNIIQQYTIGSLTPALVPLPLVDLVALTGIQLKMLHSLSNLYGLEFSDEMAKKAIASLMSGALSVSLASGAASLLKFVPIIGQASGMVSLGVLGGSSTYAIGKIFAKHFESGGDLFNFDPKAMKVYFMENIEKGKQVVLDLKNKATSTTEPDSTQQS